MMTDVLATVSIGNSTVKGKVAECLRLVEIAVCIERSFCTECGSVALSFHLSKTDIHIHS